MLKKGAEQEIIYEGIPASPGIAIAPVHVIARGFSAPEIYEIEESAVEREQERFREALEITKRQLIELQSRLEDLSGDNESGIFEAHVMILEDRSVVDSHPPRGEGTDAPCGNFGAPAFNPHPLEPANGKAAPGSGHGECRPSTRRAP